MPNILATVNKLAELRYLENASIMIGPWVLYLYISYDIFGNVYQLCANNLKVSCTSKISPLCADAVEVKLMQSMVFLSLENQAAARDFSEILLMRWPYMKLITACQT